MNGCGAYEIPALRFAGIAKTEIKLHRFLKAETDGSFGYAASTDVVVGVSGDHVDATNPIDILTGIVIVEASAAIAAGAKVMSTTDGKAATFVDTNEVVGICLTAASAAGQYITVLIK